MKLWIDPSDGSEEQRKRLEPQDCDVSCLRELYGSIVFEACGEDEYGPWFSSCKIDYFRLEITGTEERRHLEPCLRAKAEHFGRLKLALAPVRTSMADPVFWVEHQHDSALIEESSCSVDLSSAEGRGFEEY